ncbi:MAG: hypothetical protein HQM08_03500 [Candidatus Riflebacteria bacterium]|nr:hypothetical protein [Candidatus Riflebacteria bacterium]
MTLFQKILNYCAFLIVTIFLFDFFPLFATEKNTSSSTLLASATPVVKGKASEALSRSPLKFRFESNASDSVPETKLNISSEKDASDTTPENELKLSSEKGSSDTTSEEGLKPLPEKDASDIASEGEVKFSSEKKATGTKPLTLLKPYLETNSSFSVEIQLPGHFFPEPVEKKAYVLVGSKIHVKRDAKTLLEPENLDSWFEDNLTRLPRLFFPPSITGHLFPGTLLDANENEIKLLLGRILVKIEKKVPELKITTKSGFLESPTGESWAEVLPNGDSNFALVKGQAWVRSFSGELETLNSGQQISLSERGKLGKPVEIDGHWKKPASLPTFAPILWIKHKLSSPEDENASDDEDIGSDTEEVGSDSADVGSSTEEVATNTEKTGSNRIKVASGTNENTSSTRKKEGSESKKMPLGTEKIDPRTKNIDSDSERIATKTEKIASPPVPFHAEQTSSNTEKITSETK